MAPLKLPAVKSKVKGSKGKGKAKQLHIDYATLASARASAPADWSAEAWLEEGTRQEEQGERYQVGPKAARHLLNALTCYRLAAAAAATTEPEREFAFDARYNAARVSHALGADHLNPPECLEALQAARKGYREALAVAPQEEATARIDALYNLAQADASLLAQLQAGIVPPTPDRTETEKELAREAKELFSEVERLQRIELERYQQNNGGDTVDLSSDGPDQLEVEGDGGVEASVQVTAIVTPQLVIDTVLASISFDIQLSESTLLHGDPDTDSQLRQSAVDAFSRAMDLRAIVAAQEGEHEIADLDFELAVHQIEIMTTWSSSAAEGAGPRLDQLVATTADSLPLRQIDALSLLADFLVDEAIPSTTHDASNSTTTATLERALTAYQRAASLLSNRLSPPKHIPALQLPSLLSANLASQAQVHLVAHLLLLLSSSGLSSLSRLDEAQKLSIEAIAAAKPPVVLSVPTFSSSSSSTGLLPSLPTVSALRPAGAGTTDVRTDWTTLAAVRTGFFTLLRVRYYACAVLASTEPEPASLLLRDQLRARAWGEWSALGLAQGRDGGGGDGLAALKRSEVSWWLNETEEDAVANVAGAELAEAERAWWASLAP